MGVRGLQSYLEQSCSTAIPIQSILELAEFRRESPNQELIVVVDAITFVGNTYDNLKLEWIGGAQIKQFAEYTKEFVQAFRKIGIRLVFFLDGPRVPKKRNTWVKRRLDNLSKIYDVLDGLSNGLSSTSFSRKEHFLLPGGMSQHSRLIFDALCGCEVHQSILECDEEIAEYAKRNGVFGVLAHDSDYMIMDIGHALYLDMHYLDINTMKTRVHLPGILAERLELDLSQLPILATLMGTDFIQYEDLKSFHFRLAGTRNVNILVPRLAQVVKALSNVPQIENEVTTWLANNVLGDTTRVQDIKDSIDSYKTAITGTSETAHSTTPPEEEEREAMWSWLLEESRQRHKNNRQPDHIYAIMSGGAIESGNSYEDYRLGDLPTSANMTRSLRQRLYGILLQQKPRGPTAHAVEEWIMAGPGSLDGPGYNVAVFPDPPHPGLAALWSEDESIDDVRWNLFVRIVSPRLDVDGIRSLPRRLVIPAMVVYTALRTRGSDGGGLEPWEADAVIATAAVVPHYSAQRLARLDQDPLSSRSVRVSTLLTRSTSVFYNLQAACGYPLPALDTAPWTFFDGKLFQVKYRQAQGKVSQNVLCDNMADSLDAFVQTKKIVSIDRYY